MSTSPSARAQITVAILAGGQGVRVNGQDKGLMLLGGKPLVSRVCERVRDQCTALFKESGDIGGIDAVTIPTPCPRPD